MGSLAGALIVGLIYGAISVGMYFLLFPPFEKISNETDIPTSLQKRLKALKQKKFSSSKTDSDEIFKKLEAKTNKQKTNLVDMLKDTSEYKLYFLELIFNRFKFTNHIKKMLKIADVKMPIDLFIMISVGLFAPFFLLTVLTKTMLYAVMGLGLSALPYTFLLIKIRKNLSLFSASFSEALTLISNALRAGHSLLSSFQLVAEESPYPVNKLFKSVSDDIALGREVREALEDMCESIPNSQDLRFFVTAVLVQKEIGGNLTEILDILNNTIRERFKLLGLIKTQTSQAQVSGLVLALVPIAVTILVNLANPSYMEPLFKTTLGNILLGVSLLLSSLGFFIIMKITNIRV